MYKVRKVRNQPHFGIYMNGKLHSTHPTRRAAKKMMGGMINDDDPTENDEEQIRDYQQVVDQAAQDQHAGMPVDIVGLDGDIQEIGQYLDEKLVSDPTGHFVEQLIANGYTAEELIDMDLTTEELDRLQQAYAPLTEQEQIELLEDQLHEDIPALTGANLNSFARYMRHIGYTYLQVRTMPAEHLREIVGKRIVQLRRMREARERKEMEKHDPKTRDHDDKRRK